jgi:hypothetical protein
MNSIHFQNSDTEIKMKTGQPPFTCPWCGYKDRDFHQVCPGCGRPFVWDFIDTQVHPRDPNPAGIYSGKFWARVFLVCMLLGLSLYLLTSFGIIQELFFTKAGIPAI